MVNLTGQDGEEERSHKEATKLEPLATDDIDSEESKVVAWEETEGSDDDVTGGELEELAPSVLADTTITDLSEHDGLIQIDTVERNIDKEPAKHGTEENTEVVPFLEVVEELLPGSLLGDDDTMTFRAVLVSIDSVDLRRALGFDVLFLLGNIMRSLAVARVTSIFCLASKSVLAGLGKSQTIVERAESGDEGETDEDTPDLVNVLWVTAPDVRLEGREGDDGQERSDKRTPTLVGEDEAQEGSSTVDVGTIGDDRGGHWVVSTDTDTEDDTTYEDPNHDLVAREVRGDGDTDDGGDNDEDELLAVDSRATKGITKKTETDLTNHATLSNRVSR